MPRRSDSSSSESDSSDSSRSSSSDSSSDASTKKRKIKRKPSPKRQRKDTSSDKSSSEEEVKAKKRSTVQALKSREELEHSKWDSPVDKNVKKKNSTDKGKGRDRDLSEEKERKGRDRSNDRDNRNRHDDFKKSNRENRGDRGSNDRGDRDRNDRGDRDYSRENNRRRSYDRDDNREDRSRDMKRENGSRQQTEKRYDNRRYDDRGNNRRFDDRQNDRRNNDRGDRRNDDRNRGGSRREDSRDRSPVRNRRRSRSNSYDHSNAKWGKEQNDKGENSKEVKKEKEKPNFGLSGKLTEETNTYKGVVIKYSEPPEARKPKRRWRLYPFKGEKAMQTLYIHRQSAYLIGRDRKIADLPVDHPSCSKQHAVLQYRLVPFTRDDGSTGKRIRPYIIDLESANGTYINNKRIDAKKYVELLEKDVIKFGYSSREYVMLHENSKDEAQDDDVKLEDEEVIVKKEEPQD